MSIDGCIDVAIVGAGASGLMAACAASGGGGSAASGAGASAASGAGGTVAPGGVGVSGGGRLSVVVFERNERPGRKLSITGKGRCNITNNAEKEQFMRNIPGNGKFLFSAFSKMSNMDIVSFFERNGVGVALERGDRFFTRSGSAREVTDALVRVAERQGARIVCGARVASVGAAGRDGAVRGRDGAAVRNGAPLCDEAAGRDGAAGLNGASDDSVFTIKMSNGRAFQARCVILATGGVSYPATGSTGDGYKLAEGLGHSVVNPRPSLVPLETAETWPYDLTGLTLKNVSLKLFSPDGKKLFSKLGEMLFTHFGVSGPLVLSGSRALLDYGFSGCTARIDLKPGLSDEKLRARISRDMELFSRKGLKNAMTELLPSRMIPVVIDCAGLSPEQRADSIGKAGVAKLSEALKGLPLTIKSPRPMSEAIVTAGGVRINEINPATMESKIVPGLFFCGELIDVDAYTGGFNLSIAFATGHVAGTNAHAKSRS